MSGVGLVKNTKKQKTNKQIIQIISNTNPILSIYLILTLCDKFFILMD